MYAYQLVGNLLAKTKVRHIVTWLDFIVFINYRRTYYRLLEDRLSFVNQVLYLRVKWYFTNQWALVIHISTFELLTHFGCSTRRSIKQFCLAFAIWTNKATHIFNNSKDRNACFDAEAKFFTYIGKCNLLRSCYHNCTVILSAFNELD